MNSHQSSEAHPVSKHVNIH